MYQRVYVEISNRCNLHCSFCPKVEKEQILSETDFEKILLMTSPLTKEICLHLLGEPLYHPDFEKIMNQCEKHKVPTQITTNGFFIKRYTDLLLGSTALRQINFSLQSYRDNFPTGDLKKYLTPVLKFLTLATTNRPSLYINLRLWNVTDDNSNNEELLTIIEEHFQMPIKRSVDVGHYKSKRLFQRLYLHFDSRFQWPSTQYQESVKVGHCKGLIDHFGIHADGTVVPCCLDYSGQINLGNCLKENLEHILQNGRATQIREGFKQGLLVETLCQHCSYIDRFRRNRDVICERIEENGKD